MKRMFYRARLATIVWDPEKKKPLAEFVEGKFITDDDAVAERLAALGYPEVALDAEAPPLLPPDPIQPVEQKDVKPLPEGMTEEGMIAKQRREDQARMQKEAQEEAKAEAARVQEEARAKKEADEAAAAKAPKKKPRRKIKRRDKE